MLWWSHQHKKKIAAEIKSIRSQALYLPCYGHSINLAVPDTKLSGQCLSSTLWKWFASRPYRKHRVYSAFGTREVTQYIILAKEIGAFRVHPTWVCLIILVASWMHGLEKWDKLPPTMYSHGHLHANTYTHKYTQTLVLFHKAWLVFYTRWARNHMWWQKVLKRTGKDTSW